jgi:hypothetical protein
MGTPDWRESVKREREREGTIASFGRDVSLSLSRTGSYCRSATRKGRRNCVVVVRKVIWGFVFFLFFALFRPGWESFTAGGRVGDDDLCFFFLSDHACLLEEKSHTIWNPPARRLREELNGGKRHGGIASVEN